VKWPINDIAQGNWNKKYQIKENYPFYFKVNDNSRLMSFIQYKAKSDKSVKNQIQEHQEKLNEYRKVKIWLKQGSGILSFTLYDIYNSFLSHLRYNSFEDQLFNCQEISLLGPLGPFTNMPLVDCLNDELVNKFIFNSVLKNKLPSRNLRVYTDGDVKIEFGKDFKRKNTLKLRQFTDTGILFSSIDEEVLSHLGDGDFVKIHLGCEMVKNFIDDKELKSNFKNFETKNESSYFFIPEDKIIKSLSYKSAHTNEIFFFIRYGYIKDDGLGKLYSQFVSKVKKEIESFVTA
jgi:hypothetical protein